MAMLAISYTAIAAPAIAQALILALFLDRPSHLQLLAASGVPIFALLSAALITALRLKNPGVIPRTTDLLPAEKSIIDLNGTVLSLKH
jgi:hypothetical protein